MHSHLISWLREIHFNADTALATQRWKLAETVAEKITRKELLQLLRAFLFSPAPPDLIQSLARQFLDNEKEFPPNNNAEDVRLQAGIVMVTGFAQRTMEADAFALGMRASAFPKGRCKAAQLGIVDEAVIYLATEANAVRPADFGISDGRVALTQKLEAFAEAAGGSEPAPIKKAIEELSEFLHESYGQQIQRLGEESGLLWWLLGGHSSAVDREVIAMNDEEYALIAAAEAAERTHLVPPPPSAYAILGRAIAPCKRAKNRKPSLKDIVSSADSAWRSKFVVAHPAVDCADLVPLVTALKITEDAGDTDTLAKLLPKACPGVSADLPLPPLEAARQLYNELAFLKALNALG